MKRALGKFRLTRAGLVFTGITLFVLAATLNSGNNLLYLAFGLLAGTLVVSAVGATLLLRSITVERQAADHAPIGEPVEISYRITNVKTRRPCFAVRVTEATTPGLLSHVPEAYCLHLAPHESQVIGARMTAARRGPLQLKDIRISSAFPFGFVRRSTVLARPHRMVIYPRVGTVSREIALRCREAAYQGAISSDVNGGQDEFYGLREYRPGDNVRAIHWRRTARTGQIMVREMTADAPPRLIVALDVRGWLQVIDGAALAERAIELAASLACHAFHEDFAVGLHIAGGGAVDLTEPRTGREYRARLLEALALVEVEKLGAAGAPRLSPRKQGRAQWVVVTLRQSDSISEVVPAGIKPTVMAMDQPGSEAWVRY